MSTWKYDVDAKVTIRTDALVGPKYAGTHWTVVAQPRGANGKNYTLAPLGQPDGGRTRAPENILTEYTGEAATPPGAPGAVVTAVALPPVLPEAGTVVTLKIPGKVHPDRLWVVVGDSGAHKVRVFPLGGGRSYWRVTAGAFTVVPPQELAARMPAHLAATT